MARSENAALSAAAGELPQPAVLAAIEPARPQHYGPRLERLAGRRKRAPPGSVMGRRTGSPDIVFGALDRTGGAASATQPADIIARRRRSQFTPAGSGKFRGRLLHAALHPPASAPGRPRTCARSRGVPSRSARGTAPRADDKGDLRRRQSRHRGRISRGRASLWRRSGAVARSRHDTAGVRAKRSDRGGRHLQFAAAPETVGNRTGRGTSLDRHPAPGGSCRRRQQPAGPLRGWRRQSHGKTLVGARWRKVSKRRSALSRLARSTERHVHIEWRCDRADTAISSRHA